MQWALTQPISFSDAVKMHKTAVIHMRDTSKYSFLPCQVYFVAETDFEKTFRFKSITFDMDWHSKDLYCKTFYSINFSDNDTD